MLTLGQEIIMAGDDRLFDLAARLQSIQQSEQEKKDTIGKYVVVIYTINLLADWHESDL
jgi:nitrate reductase NapAB chaperone NapD